MKSFDGQPADAMERGLRNQEVMNLAANHCSHMEFWQPPGFGVGMIEAATGLPIGMRAVQCKHIELETITASANFEASATQFFTDHCVGCPFQDPNGRLPTLGALVEEQALAAREAAAAQGQASSAEHDRWLARSSRRKMMRLDGDAAIVSLSRDLDDLDHEPGLNAPDRDAARLRVEATASRAPELFTADAREVLFDMVVGLPTARTLEPLRLLTRHQPAIRRRVLEAALVRLAITHDQDAGRCLVEMRDLLMATDLTQPICRSLIMLAGAPVQGDFGHFEPSSSAEIEPLRVIVELATEMVLDVLDAMLPGSRPTSPLAQPYPNRTGDDEKRSEWAEAVERAAASSSIQALLPTHEELAARALPLLLRNLERPGDIYDHHPVQTVTEAIARILSGHLALIEQVIAAGNRADDEYRVALFDVFESMVRMFDPDRGRTSEPELDSSAGAILSALLPRVLAVMDGRWGWSASSAAGRLVEHMCSRHTRWAADNIDAILGTLISEHERSAEPSTPSPLLLLGAESKTGIPAGLEAMGKAQGRHIVLHSLRRANIHAAAGKPMTVVHALSAALTTERSTPINPEVAWDILEMFGDIAADHGEEPGLLRMVLPTLRGYLVDVEPAFRSSALRSWTKVARKQPVPDTLHDLLPELIRDSTVGVVKSLLKAAIELDWSEEDRSDLLGRVYGLSESQDTRIDPFRADVLQALLSLSRGDDTLRDANTLYVLRKSSNLDDRQFHDFFMHRSWHGAVATSSELGLATWRFYRVKRELSLQDDHDRGTRKLLEIGPGLVAIDAGEITGLALESAIHSHWTAMTLAEVLWRAQGWQAAQSLYAQLLQSIPDEPRHARLRARLQLLVDWDEPNGQPIPVPTAEMTLQFLPGQDVIADPLYRAYELRLDIRTLLEKCERRPGATPPNDADIEHLREQTAALREEASDDTDTAAYVRAVADLILVAAHSASIRSAVIDADSARANAHQVAMGQRTKDVEEAVHARWSELDPLRIALQRTIDATRLIEPSISSAICSLVAALPLPPLFIKGRKTAASGTQYDGADRSDSEAKLDVAVALFNIDGKTITGPQVLRHEHIYRLGITLRLDGWPDWATHIEGEFITDLTASEITLPSFRWARPSPFSGGGDDVLNQDGTLICRFTKGSGVPAPRFRLDLRWRGHVDGRDVVQRLDVAAHREIQLRPFDAASDALTENRPFDERLIEVFDRLRAADTDEVQVQAFARLLSAIARASLEIAWSKQYKRGAHVTERQFHDDLYERLRADPELEGRVERGMASGLGLNDLRHDGITAELKVEKQVPETRERSAKYISQTAQYATADGTRVSILCVLDVTRKEAVVAPPENYLWVLQPPAHALPDPRFPSAVAVHVINAWSPSPSSWSRKRAPLIGE